MAAKKRAADSAPELDPKTYKMQRVLGKGSFGTVYLCSVEETGGYCAIKSIKPMKSEGGKHVYNAQGPDREVQILKELNGHPNIVLLQGAFTSTTSDGPRLNLVFEFLSDTLHRVIKHHNQLQKGIDLYFVKSYFYQLVRGMAFMHGKGITHGDMKPQNLLLEGKSQRLCICDFGTARRFGLKEQRANYVCSRYFRAPEIILGSTVYDSAIDLWSVGCIFAEMIIRQPLFAGKDGVDQFVEMLKVLGTPTAKDLEAMNPNYRHQYEFKPQIAPLPWEKVLKGWTTPDGVELTSLLLKYDPHARLPPLQVLLHRYFNELRDDEKAENRSLFEFLPDELKWCTKAEQERLIPHWCRSSSPP